MSTRSTTHFLYAEDRKPTAIVYRHGDGYPEGAGADIVKFFDQVDKLRDKRFTDPSYLAAKYVVFLAEMFGKYADDPKNRLDFISVGVVTTDPGDIEYRYQVICDGKGKDGRPTLKCFHVSDDGREVNPTGTDQKDEG